MWVVRNHTDSELVKSSKMFFQFKFQLKKLLRHAVKINPPNTKKVVAESKKC